MTRQSIPEDIRRFILTSIPSVPFLEALLLLRAECEQAWDAKRLARRLYIGEKVAEDLLATLHGAGFLAAEPPADDAPEKSSDSAAGPYYRYRPISEELAQIVERVADTYSRNIVEVANLIHSNVSKQAQQFADAFKWRKDS